MTITALTRRTLLKGAAVMLAGLGGTTRAGLASSGRGLVLPDEVRAGGDVATTVEVRYGNYELLGTRVTLRSYDGLPVGRTIRVRAGNKLSVTLVNRLPFEIPDPGCGDNRPRTFNVTNLHPHGLHVSPKVDNVLLAIVPEYTANTSAEPDPAKKPIARHTYGYDIDADHPCGTYFYHCHYHGSVALQMASGMSGALIVEGPVDDIPEIRAAKEQIMTFQSPRFDGFGKCEDYALLEQPGHTTINGQWLPVIVMAPGEVQRWRLINGTHATMLDLALDGPQMVLLGRDGNPLASAQTLVRPLRLVPGNRADILVKAPLRPGRYPLAGGQGPVATLEVLDVPAKDMPLFSGNLPSFALLRPIGEAELTYGRRVTFGMAGPPNGVMYTVNNKPFSCTDPWTIKVGSVEEWTVVNQTNDIHPFHIHTNPFQLMEGGNAEPGTWLDTVEIPPSGRVRFRTRFTKYDGLMVFHCHTLVHEDQGMMQAINLVKDQV